MTLEIKDLTGLSEPLKKLIDILSSGVGALYRPRGIRLEADAKAYEIKAIERAKIEAEEEGKSLHLQASKNRIASIAEQYPELAERAKYRLLRREIEGQINIELIAEQAERALPSVVSDEPVSPDWRRKFFQEAENVCEADMQALWGKVLAGEVAQPGSFSLRTLETLKQLSRHEAELFRRICGLAMNDGWVALIGFDINTDLTQFGFSYGEIIQLRDAGLLLHGDSLHKDFRSHESVAPPGHRRVVLFNNGVFVEMSGSAMNNFQLPALIFTQSGREIQRLIERAPNEAYLSALGVHLRLRGLKAKRGVLVPRDETSSIITFEQDL